MAAVKLEALPKELIAHIATCLDASSVVRLSASSTRFRAACYDSLVFKDILLSRQRNLWHQECLDIDAIASRANHDTAAWARYAVADELAWELSQRARPLESSKDFINYLPELLIVHHPFVNEECWRLHHFDNPLDQKANLVFCLAMALLSTGDDLSGGFAALRMQDGAYLRIGDYMKVFLWALCDMVLTLRFTLKTRLDAWPYNSAAAAPYMKPPKLSQIPLRPLNDRYSLPAPFSRRAIESLGRSTSSFSSFDSWFDLHNYEQFRSQSFWTEGEWCGYYNTHAGTRYAWLDPPMTEILFQFTGGDQHSEAESEAAEVQALNCTDGIDRFDLQGTLSYHNRAVRFKGRKQYRNRPTHWDWDCRLTPFGLVGFWGKNHVHDDRLLRSGTVWLWKKEWTEIAL